MWTAFIRGAFAMGVVAFVMWVLRLILDPIIGFATNGPNSEAETVTTIGTWFGVLTLENLTLFGGIAIGLYLVNRAVVERRAAG